ncbi:CBS domain-containing protein [archaeon SCG-AAA382B04]|nr:CBS domain-containing protein [archaeon SCG-AAA382B04]
MKVGEIMDRSPLIVRENDFLTHARQVLRDNDLRAIPVLNKNDDVEGVLTTKDVLNITSSKSNVEIRGYIQNSPIITPQPSVKEVGRKMIQANLGSLPVVSSHHDLSLEGVVNIIDIFNSLEDLDVESNEVAEKVMSQNVETIKNDVPVQRCWKKMLNTGYSGFPVVKNDSLVGIITRTDLLEAGFARFKREDDSQKSGNNSPAVERLMTTPIKKIYKTTPVSEARKILSKKDIGRLPVVSTKNENKIVGIVDRYDILDSYLR